MIYDGLRVPVTSQDFQYDLGPVAEDSVKWAASAQDDQNPDVLSPRRYKQIFSNYHSHFTVKETGSQIV